MVSLQHIKHQRRLHSVDTVVERQCHLFLVGRDAAHRLDIHTRPNVVRGVEHKRQSTYYQYDSKNRHQQARICNMVGMVPK